jgi:hypothetical protein
MIMKERKTNGIGLLVIILGALTLWIPLNLTPCAQAQQTLGGITGSVSDETGGVLPGTEVTIVGDQTKLTRTQKTNANGIYEFVNLPIGTYTLTFTHDGFETQRIPSITVQADRTATVNAVLPVGQVGTVVEVQAEPLMNAVDTTNGYVMDDQQIQGCPAAHRQLHRTRHSISRRECRTSRRHRRKQRPRQPADLGEWAARYQQQFLA